MRLAVDVLCLTVLLFAIEVGIRHARAWVAWAVFLALPLALTWFWVNVNDIGFFPWVKLYTILFSVCWLTALRFTQLGEHAWARLGMTALFAVNILEAVVVDAVAGGIAHGMNAVAGAMFIATLPRSPNAIETKKCGEFRNLHFHGINRGWIVGYTLWNWAFIYLNYPVLVGHQTAVLAATLAVGLIDPRRWLQARMSILAINLIALSTFRVPLFAWLDTSDLADPWLEVVAVSTALVATVGLLISYPSSERTQRSVS